MKYYYNYIFLYNVIYSCDSKLNFHHNYSILQGHMILQKSILCWDAAQETFLLIIKIVNSCATLDFCENHDHFFHLNFYDKYNVRKEHHWRLNIFIILMQLDW